jgi:hypothetical protein
MHIKFVHKTILNIIATPVKCFNFGIMNDNIISIKIIDIKITNDFLLFIIYNDNIINTVIMFNL